MPLIGNGLELLKKKKKIYNKIVPTSTWQWDIN
jgi:hypothetical protein